MELEGVLEPVEAVELSAAAAPVAGGVGTPHTVADTRKQLAAVGRNTAGAGHTAAAAAGASLYTRMVALSAEQHSTPPTLPRARHRSWNLRLVNERSEQSFSGRLTTPKQSHPQHTRIPRARLAFSQVMP